MGARAMRLALSRRSAMRTPPAAVAAFARSVSARARFGARSYAASIHSAAREC